MDFPHKFTIIKPEASNKQKGRIFMNTILANNLKKFRQQKNLTQEQVASILNVNAHTVSRWECNTTMPDILLLPEIAKLYCVSIDDLFKETSVAYDNYAQKLASIYEASKNPEDFIRADLEFRQLMKTNCYSTEDLRLYGVLHHYMMQYCMNKAIQLFDKVLEKGSDANEYSFWRTKHQKMALYTQIGKGKESINEMLAIVNNGSMKPEEWVCLITAYEYVGNYQTAYEWFLKAIKNFPENASLYVHGGDLCKSLGRYDEALTYWDKGFELEPQYLDTRYSKAFFYEEQSEYEKAYHIWCEIVAHLKKEGLVIEAEEEEKHAQVCFEKIEN